MIVRNFHRRSRRQGFTLVELVIVGALIALFSSLAVFGVQQQYRANIRKATIGEARNIATALEFANLDTGVFPRLCWLTESRDSMTFVSQQINGDNFVAFDAMDINGRGAGTLQGRTRSTKWNGPYFALSQTRSGVAQGRGGFVYMLLPEVSQQGPNDLGTQGIGLRWPADPYNNPYVVYMLDVDPANGQISFVNSRPNAENQITVKGNYVNAVVSYGQNRIPGGADQTQYGFGPRGTTDAAVVSGIGADQYGYRLYHGVPDYRPSSKGVVTHTALTAAEYTPAKAAIWSRRFFAQAGIDNSWIGITDPNTDDIIFEF